MPNEIKNSNPFLRWAGSKRKQLSRLNSFWSDEYSRYVEPFCGSACLFFYIAPEVAILGDNNKGLVELFRVVRDNPEKLHARLLRVKRDLPTYLRWRSLNPKTLDKETRALRFLYLNRNCFNGIYRTNNKGDFNVPMGSKPSKYFALTQLLMCSSLLQNCKLVPGDFSKTLSFVERGDFVYLDPPFAMSTPKRRVFREYGAQSFSTFDIPRFDKELKKIDKKGAVFLVSYADCAESRALSSAWNSVRIPVKRNIAGFVDNRKLAYETLISNTIIPINLTT